MKLRVLAVIAALLVPAIPASAATEEPWEFEGGGWGHGVGMSQFGAQGRAQAGHSYQQILKHYYTGVSMGNVPESHWSNEPNGLWIGIAPNRFAADLAAPEGPVTFCLPNGECEASQIINPGESWRFETAADDSTKCRLRELDGKVDPTPWGPCRGTAEISPSNRLTVNNVEYGRGTVRFTPSPDGFHTVVALDLESYLYGLDEVPFSWHDNALRAQAVAGRSYAVATAKERGGSDGSAKDSRCGCHLFATTVDQAYDGWSTETKEQASRWRGAVDHTSSEVVTYESATVKTFYSSSNGGWSETSAYAFGGTQLPWLQSVEDPYSADPNVNPLAKWSVKVSDEAMADYFRWDRVLDAYILEGPPGVLVQFAGYDNGEEVNLILDGPNMASLVRTIGFGYEPVLSGNTSIRVSPYFSAVTDPPGFDDIIGNTFENDIEWLLNEEVTKGCNPPDNTRFCPLDDVSRGEMAAFLTRYFDLPAASADQFTDDTGSTFENDINRLAEAGITRGCNPPANDEFCPDDRVSREQMAAFLVRAFELSANTHEGFTDVPSSNTFFNDIGKLATAGITRGCNPPDNTRYCPADNVTRGEMAAFLHRADDLK